MLHFSCDLCGCQLKDERYVVKLEVFPAYDPEELNDDVLDTDHLQEVADTLHEMELNGVTELTDDDDTHFYRYDLCGGCHKKFLSDPLGRDAIKRFKFSEN